MLHSLLTNTPLWPHCLPRCLILFSAITKASSVHNDADTLPSQQLIGPRAVGVNMPPPPRVVSERWSVKGGGSRPPPPFRLGGGLRPPGTKNIFQCFAPGGVVLNANIPVAFSQKKNVLPNFLLPRPPKKFLCTSSGFPALSPTVQIPVHSLLGHSLATQTPVTPFCGPSTTRDWHTAEYQCQFPCPYFVRWLGLFQLVLAALRDAFSPFWGCLVAPFGNSGHWGQNG